MVISPTASDQDLRYLVAWWRRRAREMHYPHDFTANEKERARYAAGAEQIEKARRDRASA